MKILFRLFLLFVLFGLIAFYFTGLFVIQPIGAIPEGATIWFNRYNTNFPFISSADGLLLESQGQVSLLGRAVFLGGLSNILKEKEILRFPYVETLYLISTKGNKFEK